MPDRSGPAYDPEMKDRLVPGTLRFSDPAEREETCIRAARLLVRIAMHKDERISPRIAEDAARRLPCEGLGG